MNEFVRSSLFCVYLVVQSVLRFTDWRSVIGLPRIGATERGRGAHRRLVENNIDDKLLRWSRGSVLAFSTQIRILRAKKSSACLPSEGK
jgi:hypothetical protein